MDWELGGWDVALMDAVCVVLKNIDANGKFSFNQECMQNCVKDMKTEMPPILSQCITLSADVFMERESRRKWVQIFLSTNPAFGKDVDKPNFDQYYCDFLKAGMVLYSVCLYRCILLFIPRFKYDTIHIQYIYGLY